MAKKKRVKKSTKKSLSKIVKRAMRQNPPPLGMPLAETPIILNDLAVKKFVGRWMEFYGMDGLASPNELWGVYPLQTITQDGLQILPREDGRIVWILQAHIESDIRWSHLNALASNNGRVTVTEIEISGELIEVDFIVDSEKND